MNRNRILGITALLAVVVLGLAFVACPTDTEDREITFINMTAVPITVNTDGSPKTLDLDAASSSTDKTKKGTVTKTGSDITFTSIIIRSGSISSNWDRYIDMDLSGVTFKKNKDGSVSFGSGSVTFSGRQIDSTTEEAFGNNENPALFN